MNPLQKTEEEELGEEEEKADEGMDEAGQEVGPPLLTPLSEDAGNSPHFTHSSGGDWEKGRGSETGGGGHLCELWLCSHL